VVCINFTGTGSGSILHGEKPSQQEKNLAFQTGSSIRPDASIAVDQARLQKNEARNETKIEALKLQK
jgi:hypothetical protein